MFKIRNNGDIKMHNIQLISEDGPPKNTRVFLDGKELEAVIAFSYNISVGSLGRVSLEFYTNSIQIDDKDIVIEKNKKKIDKKINRFEIMDLGD